ncbi:MAG TPA: glycosyltransferase [Acidimicrobiia bacterium]|nr:glycosyltransferase [Acidimicrobiia bacterium]
MKASIVMAVRGEPVDRVVRALASLAVQQACEPLEVVIAAPPEEHRTLARVRPAGAVTSVVLVENPCGARSPGLNRAVAATSTPVVVRVDARSVVPTDYVARCVRRLEADPMIGVVGGVQRPTARVTTARARGIARALRNPWVLGGARYRRVGAGGSADTVYLGAFRRDELLALGGYDGNLAANEDFDLCARYRRAGRRVWIEEGLEVGYEARTTYGDLWRQYRAFGAAKVHYWRDRRSRPQPRQALALGAAAAGLVAAAGQVRHPWRAVALASGAVAAIGALDHVVDPGDADIRVRAHAVAASVCVMAAWTSGIAVEAAHRRP